MQNEELTIIQMLKRKEIKAQKYFGELSNPENANIDFKNCPLIFVDYIGSTPKDLINDSHSFNLYIVHISFSKNEKNRTNKHLELYELLQKAKDALNLKKIEHNRIYMDERKKIFDKAMQNGYLTVFLQNLKIT